MALNKFEKQVKEQLDSREIQPSAQAWDRLDAMLTIAEEKKTKRSFGWLYIAASVVVLLLAGMFFFSQKNTGIAPQGNVVQTEIKDTIQKANQLEAPVINKEEVAVAADNRPPSATAHPGDGNQSDNNQSVSINNQKPSNQKSTDNPLINRDKQIEFQGSSDVALRDLPKIEERTPKVVYSSPKSQSIPSDEQLLAGLDNSAKKSASQKSTVSVDAKSLLSQVDGELEMTFRERVINKVSKNYKEVKVALANRNHE